MRKPFFYLIVSLFSVFTFSCETTVEVKLPDQESKIVVNATLSPDSVITVHISKSVGALENKQKSIIYSAKVKLYENDVFKEELVLNTQGFFSSPSLFKPSPEKNYKIEVTASNYKSVMAVSKVPSIVIPTSITYIDSAFTENDPFSGNKEWYSQIDVTINDDATVTNYYAIQLLQQTPVFDTLDNIIAYSLNPVYIKTNNPNAEVTDTDCMISDEFFNGSSYKISINVSTYNFANDSISTYYLYFKNVSKELYLYKKTLNKYYNANGNPFAEPVRVYSNVENGMGIFCAYSYTLKKIK